MNVEHREGHFTGYNRASLFFQSWLPTGTTPHAAIVNLHGLGDHSGLYPNLVGHLAACGYAVYGFDMRGNGRSTGQRAYISEWREYREDLHAFISLVREWQPRLPLFLVGNSLGGLVVLEYALHHPVGLAGVIAAAPPLGKLGVPRLLMSLGRIMSRIIPRLSLHVGMDLAGLARDQTVIETVLADPFFHRRGTARLSTEVVAAIARVQNGASRFSLPLLLLHGSEDRMVPPDGTRAFFSKLSCPERQFREYPGAYHGLFADIGYHEVLGDVEQWLDARLTQYRKAAGAAN